MDNSFEKLLEKHKSGTLTPGEAQLFLHMLRSGENDQVLEQAIDQDWERDLKNISDKESLDLIYQQILIARETPVVKLPFYRRSWVAVAASVIVILVITALVLLSNNKGSNQQDIARQEMGNDVAPGKFKARLTLADGSTIVLDSATAGELARQGGTVVLHKNGQLVYSPQPGTPNGEPMYNTLSTARGETYTTVLADGSKVWLNAASSIRFPVSFSGEARRVEITGEAYFEVAHDSRKPFHVTVNSASLSGRGMDVQVLGTHFNINSYADEGVIKTTLLEGSISIAVAGNNQIVKPGQQAQVKDNNITLSSNVDTDAVMAWKNGFFSFEGTDIKGLMTEISRWYDIEVIYQGMPDATFTGKIDRNLTLSQLLEGLAQTKVNYKIEGKKLIILP